MDSAARPVRATRVPTISCQKQPGRFVRITDLQQLRKCDQAAAVCYRLRGNQIQFLLVRTRNGKRWTFPKGGIEPGLSSAQAAAMEAFEEAGVHGRIEESSFTRYLCRKGAVVEGKTGNRSQERQVAIYAYLCEVLKLSKPKESHRDRTWVSIAEAKRRLQIRRDFTEGRALARVVDRAAISIEQMQRVEDRAATRIRNVSAHTDHAKDALQKVQFEAPSGFVDWRDRFRFARSRIPGLGAMHQSQPFDAARTRKMLQADILQFTSPSAVEPQSSPRHEHKSTIAKRSG
jgi:8-oxo-dGTP pyrophosphatase MutT (NUDIX family)